MSKSNNNSRENSNVRVNRKPFFHEEFKMKKDEFDNLKNEGRYFTATLFGLRYFGGSFFKGLWTLTRLTVFVAIMFVVATRFFGPKEESFMDKLVSGDTTSLASMLPESMQEEIQAEITPENFSEMYDEALKMLTTDADYVDYFNQLSAEEKDELIKNYIEIQYGVSQK